MRGPPIGRERPDHQSAANCLSDSLQLVDEARVFTISRHPFSPATHRWAPPCRHASECVLRPTAQAPVRHAGTIDVNSAQVARCPAGPFGGGPCERLAALVGRTFLLGGRLGRLLQQALQALGQTCTIRGAKVAWVQYPMDSQIGQCMPKSAQLERRPC
mmetsp:Transcript_36097/g.103923  ORF Transcript_36097/g.103923 Transcript_36097/m.103923 type:complete len:159 (+) Transcript_36097:159-635(+)